MLFVVMGAAQVIFAACCLIGPAAYVHRFGPTPPIALAWSLVLFGAFSMTIFWISYLLLPGQFAANILRWLFVITVVGTTISALVRRQIPIQLLAPMMVFGAACVLLLVWAHAGADMTQPLRVAAQRWTHALPGDNAIPFDFAEGFRNGHIPSPLHASWLSSDRHPLQTAMYMVTPGFLLWPGNEVAYQAAAVSFQMFALLGSWILAQAVGSNSTTSILAIVALFFTPFTLVNGAFVWPKLLAAAYLSLAVAVHFGSEQARSGAAGLLVGVAAALAMLSHGSSVFVLFGMAAAAVLVFRWGSLPYATVAVLALSVFYVPWIAYQRHADPPGNRLLKWHLAGIEDVDARPLGTALRDAYAGLSSDEIIARRMKNIAVLTSGTSKNYVRTWDSVKAVIAGDFQKAADLNRQTREDQFFVVGLGVGIVGFLSFAIPFLIAIKQTRAIAIITLFSLIFWISVLFRPGHAVIHQGSYFIQTSMVMMPIIGIGSFSLLFAFTVVLIHVLVTVFQYTI
jgi:hypothetical protein